VSRGGQLRYVEAQRSRDGALAHWYFRRHGRRWPLPGTPGSVAFATAYNKLLAEHGAAPKPVKLSGDTRGYVYFLKAGKRWKIGFSTKPLSRTNGLRASAPYSMDMLVVVRGLARHERLIHNRLSAMRQNGEWFSDNRHVRKLALVIAGRGCDWLGGTQ
jgi:hypothetical protein